VCGRDTVVSLFGLLLGFIRMRSARSARTFFVLGLLIGNWCVTAYATPIYAIRSAQACNTCHIEPTGWNDPIEHSDRRCTLDCRGCHVNRNGGGLRTSAGEYYGQDTLPTFSLDERPRTFGDPEAYRSQGDPSTLGRYRLWDGFSGWQGGQTKLQKIEDRFGSIDPDPGFDVGLNARVMGYFRAQGSASVFPMQFDVHLWAKITEWLHTYGTIGLQGQRTRSVDDIQVHSYPQELVSLREWVLEYEATSYPGYIRAGRFQKSYGWGHPDHTISVRTPLEQGQYNQVWGVEAGWNPNYPFVTGALFYQGLPGFPGDQISFEVDGRRVESLWIPSGTGGVVRGGYRDLGWSAGGSVEVLHLLDATGRLRLSSGVFWGLNLYPLVVLGQVDVQAMIQNAGAFDKPSLSAYHELNWLIYQGITVLASHSYRRTSIEDDTTGASRYTLGLQWDILPHIQLAHQARLNYAGTLFDSVDFLMWIHIWL
jgi:hypothetical protein